MLIFYLAHTTIDYGDLGNFYGISSSNYALNLGNVNSDLRYVYHFSIFDFRPLAKAANLGAEIF